MKYKEGGRRSRWGEASNQEEGLTPVKEEKEGGLSRKNPKLQHSFEKVLARPIWGPGAKAAHCKDSHNGQKGQAVVFLPCLVTDW